MTCKVLAISSSLSSSLCTLSKAIAHPIGNQEISSFLIFSAT